MAEEVKTINGAFATSLKRNFKDVRDDRAQIIIEDAELTYKRTIEDMEVSIKRLQRDRESLIDLAPDNKMSIKLPTDFNSREFTDKDITIGIKIRELQIKLEIAKERYSYLFEK